MTDRDALIAFRACIRDLAVAHGCSPDATDDAVAQFVADRLTDHASAAEAVRVATEEMAAHIGVARGLRIELEGSRREAADARAAYDGMLDMFVNAARSMGYDGPEAGLAQWLGDQLKIASATSETLAGAVDHATRALRIELEAAREELRRVLRQSPSID